MDILDDMKKESQLVQELQILRDRIISTESALESLKERRLTVLVELRSLKSPVPFDDLAHLSGMSSTHTFKIVKQAIKRLAYETSREKSSLQEQVDLYNAQLQAEANSPS